MPRILSRNASLYKPKRSRASSSRTAMPSSCFLSPDSPPSGSSRPATEWFYSVPVSRDEEEGYYGSTLSSSPSSSPSQPYGSSESSVCSNGPSIPYYMLDESARPVRLEQRRSIFSQTSDPSLSTNPDSSSTTVQNSSCEDDVWGHFVDTAEAEAAIIRHSKILSKLYSMQ
jgi:hypothetical protein